MELLPPAGSSDASRTGLFAHPPEGFSFGSEFEGYDWVIGFASVGMFIGALAGTWVAPRRRRD